MRATLESRVMGPKLLAAFFVFGACMSGLAALTLFWPGTWLDMIWKINPEGHVGMLAAGPMAAAGMAILSVVMSATAIGLFAWRRWAWWAAVAVLTVNALADLTTAILRHELRTLIGVPIVALILWWMTRSRVRARFC
jgi:hypothetical protein